MRYKLCEFCENRARDTPPAGRLCSTFRLNLSKNFNFGGPTPLSLHRWGVKFGALLHAKFHPHRCNVSPLQGEKPQNRRLSKLNTGRLALRAMLPANISFTVVHVDQCCIAVSSHYYTSFRYPI